MEKKEKPKEELEKRKCFGTTEYSKICGICKACHNYEECGKVQPRRKNVMSRTERNRVFKDYRLYNRGNE